MKLNSLPISATLMFGRLFVRPLVRIRKILGLPLIVRVQRRGLNYELDLSEGIDSSIYLKGDFEKDVRLSIEQHTAPGMGVLDIGANIGGHTLDFAKCVGVEGIVYAFEPTQFAFKKLQIHCSLNPDLKIIPLQIGLTDHQNTPLPEMISSSWNLVRNSKEANPLDYGFAQSIQGARQLSLDQWVLETNINQIDIIKIDVDGQETKVLRGGIETLKKFKPKLIMEFAPHHFTNSNETFMDMLQILISLNYKFERLDGITIDDSPENIQKNIPRGVLLYVVAKAKDTNYH